MKEYERSVLYKGIKPTLVVADAEYLNGCYGLVPTKDGLRPYKQCETVIGEQCFSLTNFELLLADYKLALLKNGIVIDKLDCGTARLSIVDFQNYAVIGSADTFMLLKNDVLLPMQNSDIPLACCYTSYNGQAIAGGIYGDWFGCGLNSVAWAPVRSTDFTRIPEAGWLHFDNNKILWLAPLGERVIVYGDNYITSLVPNQYGYGEKYVFSFGLANPFAIAGDRRTHVFVNRLGEVWRYNHNGEYKNLDYSWLFAEHVYDIRVLHRMQHNDYIITVPATGRSYNLTEDGLGEANQYLLGCAPSINVGIASEQNIFRLQTANVNFRQSSLDTLREIEVQGIYEKAECVVHMAYQNDTIRRNTVKRPLTYTKMAVVNATSSSFFVDIVGALTPDTQINKVLYRYSLSDRHHIRGASDVD